MNSNNPLVELKVDALAAGGRGVARRDGKVWMVEGAVPGDRVLAETVRDRPRLVEGRTARVLEPSALRREPPCPLQGVCGGCPWMILSEDSQREWKRLVVRDSLERIARIPDPPLEPVVPSPLELGYRGKAEFSVGKDLQGRNLVGFRHRYDPGRIVDVSMCPVIPAAANRVLGEVRRWIGASGDGGTIGRTGPQGRRILLRQSGRYGSVLVIFKDQGREWTGPRHVVRKLAALPDVAGVVALTGLPGRRGGASSRLLAGKDYLEEELGGTVFKVPASAFFQVNPAAAGLLVEKVLEMSGTVGAGDRVLDLYGGVGIFAWALAARGAGVTVCEADHYAVQVGRSGTGSPGHPDFVRDDVVRFLERQPSSTPPGVVVANPPRTGLGKGVAKEIVRLRSRRVVLVSCDPGTLARDLRPFLDNGYILRRVVPVDLFPQTSHVETVSLLKLQSGL